MRNIRLASSSLSLKVLTCFSVTGRTLPHCYVEINSMQVANDLIMSMDRKQLGDRTVRIKWERRGELMRDVSSGTGGQRTAPGVDVAYLKLFSQDAYFSQPAPSPAAAPLPPAPTHYVLPSPIVADEDLKMLVGYCRRAVSSAG